MGKEEQIKEMLKHNTDYCDTIGCEGCFKCVYYDFAEKLINAGYGDVKQAVKELAEKLKESFKSLSRELKQTKSKDTLEIASKAGMIGALLRSEELVDELITELYGADE